MKQWKTVFMMASRAVTPRKRWHGRFAENSGPAGMDLLSAIVHEFGHILGQ